MSGTTRNDTFHSGALKVFERKNSRGFWTEFWAVLGHDSLRLFANYDSFLNGQAETKLISLTAGTSCQNVRREGQHFHFKICSGDAIILLKCDSESIKQEWLDNLEKVLSSFCQHNCFHCSQEGDSIESDIVDNSSASSDGSLRSRTSESRMFGSRNNSRYSTGIEDQVTKSPLKLYDEEQTIFTSFNKTEKTSATLDDQKTAQSAGHKSEKLPHIVEQDFACSVEGDSLDSMPASSLKLFDTENKRFSTFSKQSSLKREHPNTGFANPSFTVDDDIRCRDIPKTIPTVFNSPLDYNVPTLSKSDPRQGSLKVLTGKNNWKRYQAFVEKNFLYLNEPDNSTAKPTFIELKSNINFTLLPRRNHDYRFKMTSGASEYFFKTSNVVQRDSWIKTLTDATRSVCQNTCPRCCARAATIGRYASDSNLSEASPLVPDDNGDDVFYAGMANPEEGVTFRNLSREEYSHSEETVENDQIDGKKHPSLRSGYMKTNAIDNHWEQYWAILSGNQLQLHSSEDNLNTLKTIELSQNVQCKTAKRGSYDFRFTLITSATQSYEFKCASAHDRREWMTSLERAGGGGQNLNTGSRISEIVTKIRENESRLEDIQEQQKLEKLQETQRGKELKQQQKLPQSEELQEHQQVEVEQQEDSSQDIYDDFAEPNGSSLAPPTPNESPPVMPPQKGQQQVEGRTEVVEDTYEVLPGEDIQEQLPPPPPQQKKQQELKKHPRQSVDERDQHLYEVVPAEKNKQESSENQEDFCKIISANDVLSKQKGVSKENEKHKNTKGKKIVPLLPKKVKKKQDKEEERKHEKQKKGKLNQERKANSKETQTREETAKRLQQDMVQRNEETVKDRKGSENILYEKYEESLECETQNSSWNFEEHIQVLQDAGDNFADSENDAWSEAEESSSAGAFEEIVPENKEIPVLRLLLELQDVERFLTQVLGKLDNLPDDVNKERLEISKRLQKFLNIPKNKTSSRKKAPLPTPTEPVEEIFDEVGEGEYGDVAVSGEDIGQETYDDVQVQQTQDGEETYDDVAQSKLTDEPAEEDYDDVVALKPAGNSNSSAEKSEEDKSEPEELYDDVDPLSTPSRATEPRPSSKISNNSRTLEVKNVEEPRKVSDFTDKIYEGFLDKYRTKGFMKGFATKWQRRYCVLTPLALYYYENKDDKRQKGQIILPSSDCTVRQGCPSFPEVKEKKLCFELGNNERCFLFKVSKETEQGIWVKHIQAAFQTDLSDEQSKIMRLNSMSHHDDDDVEDLYEDVETFQKPSSKNSVVPEPVDEEMYELTDQFSQVKDTSGSSSEAPALPSRNKAPSEETPVALEEEQFEEIDEMEDYEISGEKTPKPGGTGNTEEKPPAVSSRHISHQQESPTLPPRSSSAQESPHLPPRSKPDAQKPPELPTRATPPSSKKSAPDLPPRTTPTLVKKNQDTSSEEPEPSPPPTPVEPDVKPDVKPEVAPPPVKTKPKGEQFDYAKVYVAMWNCSADDEDDLAFSRGNYLYIREKIPNSDWWVASLMDVPDIRVGLVPRNYIMPAYELNFASVNRALQ